jgi:hypothetical protein
MDEFYINKPHSSNYSNIIEEIGIFSILNTKFYITDLTE